MMKALIVNLNEFTQSDFDTLINDFIKRLDIFKSFSFLIFRLNFYQLNMFYNSAFISLLSYHHVSYVLDTNTSINPSNYYSCDLVIYNIKDYNWAYNQ